MLAINEHCWYITGIEYHLTLWDKGAINVNAGTSIGKGFIHG